jgi:trimeric autotransporter adhesin
MNTTYFVRTLFMGLIFFSFSLSFASSGITFHGRLLMPDGVTPVSSATTQFRIQIRTPDAENCLLWEEQQTRDLSTTNGTFTLTIADTSEPSLIANVLPYTLERIFSNRTNFTGLTGCSVGSTFNPTSGDGRNLQVYFREVPTDPWEQMPLTKINFVPLSLNSIQLAGYDASEFLKIDPLSSYTTLTAANVNTLVDIISGATTQYLKPSSAFSGDVTGTSSTTVVEKIRGTNVVATAPTTGQVLKYDGTNWAPAADDTGSTGDASYAAKGIVQINTDQTTSGLFIASGVLAMPNVIAAGGPTGGASTVPVITYDQKGRLTAVTTATVDDTTKLPLAGGTMTGPINMGTQNITNATSVAATNFSGRNLILSDNDTNTVTIKTPTDVTADYVLTLPPNDGGAGEVLTTDGSGVLTWGAGGGSSISVTANQAVVANGTGTGLTSFTCSINQVMSFDGTGLPVCGNVTGAGGFIQNGNSYGAAATLGTNDNYDLNFETNGTTKMTVLANGNVGIGSTSPNYALDVGGTIYAAPSGSATAFRGYSNASGNSGAVLGVDMGVSSLPSAAYTTSYTSGNFNLTQSSTFNQTSGTYNAVSGNVQKSGPGTVNIANGGQFSISNSTGTTTTATGVGANVINAGTITNAYGVNTAVFNSGTLTNGYGVYVGTVGGTNKFSFYASDATAPSYFAGNVGIGTTTPNTQLDITGAFSQRGMAAPAVSVAGQGRIYFDSTANKFKVSENNGAYADLVGGGGGIGGSGTSGKVAKFSASGTIADSVITELSGNIGIGTATPAAVLDVNSTLSQTSGIRNGQSNTTTISNPSASSAIVAGVNNTLLHSGSGSQTGKIYAAQNNVVLTSDQPISSATGTWSKAMSTGVTSQVISNITGELGSSILDGAAAVTTAIGVKGEVKTSNVSSISSAYGLYGSVENATGMGPDSITSAYGIYSTVVNYNPGTSTIGTGYGLYVGPIGGTVTYGIYQSNVSNKNYFAGNVGIGTTTPNTQLDITGAFSQRGMAAPAVSVAGQGRIYFDSTANKFKVSENNGAYTDLVGGGGGSISGLTTGAIPKATSSTTIGDSIMSESSGKIGIGTAAPVGILDVRGGTANSGNGTNISLYAENGFNSGNTNGGDILLMPGNSFGVAGVRGHVGIGVTNPTSLLHLDAGGSATGVRIDGTGAPQLTFFNGATLLGVIGGVGTTGSGILMLGSAPNDMVIRSGGNLLLGTSSTESMRISGTNVGIGTTSPNTQLDITGAFSQRGMAAPAVSVAGQGRIYFDSTANKFKVSENNGAYADLVGGSSISVTSNQAVVANGTGTGLSSFTCSINQVMSFDGSGLPVCTGVTGTGGFLQDGNSYGAAATLGTNDNYALNFETNGTTKMTVLANGNVGIGTTNPVQALDVNGTVQAIDFVSTSDRRLKKDIQPILSALEKLKLITGVSWRWIANDERDMGVIAQDVEKVFPDLVVTDRNGKKSVKYGNLVGPVIEAVKELSNEVATLKTENTEIKTQYSELKIENAELKIRLERIEKMLELNETKNQAKMQSP